jgi:hypothetical protein
MAVPDYQTLMLPLLRRAAAKEGETHIGALVDEIAGEQKLSDEDLSALSMLLRYVTVDYDTAGLRARIVVSLAH